MLASSISSTGWPTVASRDYRHPNKRSFQERHGNKKGEQLNNLVAHLAGWSTPIANDSEAAGSRQAGGKAQIGYSLTDQVRGDFGTGRSGTTAPTDGRVVLNPQFALWLMGYPVEWGNCAPRGTRSSRRSPPSSSEP